MLHITAWRIIGGLWGADCRSMPSCMHHAQPKLDSKCGSLQCIDVCYGRNRSFRGTQHLQGPLLTSTWQSLWLACDMYRCIQCMRGVDVSFFPGCGIVSHAMLPRDETPLFATPFHLATSLTETWVTFQAYKQRAFTWCALNGHLAGLQLYVQHPTQPSQPMLQACRHAACNSASS